MKKLKTALIMSQMMMTTTSAFAFPNAEEVFDGFVCKTDQLKLAVKFEPGQKGAAVTKILTPKGVLKFESKYKKLTSLHYRWGYADQFISALAHQTSGEPFGKISINVEHQGPTALPNGEFGYKTRAVRGYLEFLNSSGEKKKAYLACAKVAHSTKVGECKLPPRNCEYNSRICCDCDELGNWNCR